MLFVRQFRAGSGRDSLEPPGGLLDPGEDPCSATARELLEETGYAGDPPELLGSAYSNPSLMSSRIAIVVIRNARPVAAPKPDDLEEVALELVPARAVPRLIRDGTIDHALSVMALLWYFAAIFPGPLARPKHRRNTIRAILLYTAVFALALGLVMNLKGPFGAEPVVAVIPALVITIAFSAVKNLVVSDSRLMKP
jgi:8-oxo-dGTP pyrophosphatase MutT (NUDIX family)